jgi:putative SOS response-associated peptidase YedK
MCGRYSFDPQDYDFYRRFVIKNKTFSLKPSYNVAPADTMPVVVSDGSNTLELMRWGLVPFFAKDPSIGSKMINARAETVAEKPSFKRLLTSKRCLVPASGFYEWKQFPEGKLPHHIRVKGETVFAFAGLYDVWKDPKNGTELKTYTIITTEPNELMQPIHNRMPVILSREDEAAWLNPDLVEPEQLTPLLKSFPAELMEAFQVSRDVNSPRNNSPQLVEPISHTA